MGDPASMNPMCVHTYTRRSVTDLFVRVSLHLSHCLMRRVLIGEVGFRFLEFMSRSCHEREGDAREGRDFSDGTLFDDGKSGRWRFLSCARLIGLSRRSALEEIQS